MSNGVMYSPADHCGDVPKRFHENIAYRQSLVQRCRDDAAYREEVKRKCKEDIFYWIDTFAIQFNPKDDSGTAGEYGPFICWNFQRRAIREILWCIENGEDLAIEKSRQMGCSWIIVLVFIWLWLFHPGKSLLMVSRKQDLVDSHLPISLFWKIDLVLKYLPKWLMPKGWKQKEHRLKNYFENPELGSYIFGEATTQDIAVGGTLTAIALDEFARVEKDFVVLESTVQSTKCRLFNSTHLGTDTAFYEICQPESGTRKLVIHWTEHPYRVAGKYSVKDGKLRIYDKTYKYAVNYKFVMDGSPTGGPHPGIRSVWYDKECIRTKSSRGVAQNLDIDPTGSVSLVFEPLVIRLLKETFTAGQYGRDFWQGNITLKNNVIGLIDKWKLGEGPIRYWGHLDERGFPKIEPTDFFGAGCDISEGRGKTPSVCSIVKETGEKILAVATANMRPWEFAVYVVAICRYFNNALLCWETPGPGYTFGDRVLELDYWHVHWDRDENDVTPKMSLKTPGWLNTGDRIVRLLEDYKEALEGKQFLNHDWFALDETLQFRYNRKGIPEHAEYACEDKDPSGARINHGDRVIGDALGWKMVRKRANRMLAEQRREKKPDRYDLTTSQGRVEWGMLMRNEDRW